jgi:hypothetical protein
MCAVPTRLRNEVVESLFPTLKRGANKHCAYGAGCWFRLAWSDSTQAPTGLRNEVVESLFPTLKRGANKHCAYGAGCLLRLAWSDSTQAP